MSQFASLFKTDAKQKTEKKPESKTETKPAAKSSGKSSPKKPVAAPPLAAEKSVPVKTEKRLTGKSSNPDYAQVLTYIRRDTHNAVRAALIFDEQKRDMSDLVEELLAGWVKNNSR
jgi:hypothetical protein